MIFKTGIVLIATFLVMLTGWKFYAAEKWYRGVLAYLLGIGVLFVFISGMIALLSAGLAVLP